EWTDFIPVQVSPGVVGVVQIKPIQLDGENVKLYITPIFSDSSNPVYNFTFPATLAKDITRLFGQYLVEMTWMSTKDIILIPAIKELLIYTENQKSKVGKALFDERQWDLFIQIFTLTDRLQHPAWRFREGNFPEKYFKGLYNEEIIQKEAVGAIDEAYIKADIWLGDMLRNFNPQKDVLIIVSDHGFTAGTGEYILSGDHRLEGIYVVWGGPVKALNSVDFMKNQSSTKSIKDITKNILYLMGLPTGADMIGEFWFDLYDESWVESHQPTTIPTYDKEDQGGTQHPIDPSSLEQLKGLGYLE
ncbi:alkaline phosphatase family protein, partial [bacterium]|nr:alkaline phosphatase family protein [bacterium]MBU1025517.1 alkaline phosphatase family protein [bacterium]